MRYQYGNSGLLRTLQPNDDDYTLPVCKAYYSASPSVLIE